MILTYIWQEYLAYWWHRKIPDTAPLKSVLDKNLITSVRNKPDSEQLTEVIDSFEIVIYRYFILEEDILSGNEQINMK